MLKHTHAITLMFLLCLGLFSPVSALYYQANTLNIPEKVQIGEKIVAKCNCATPESGRLNIIWSIPQGLDTVQASENLYIWGKPGKYKISCIVIPVKTITVSDQTFEVLAGQIVNLTANFQILGKIDPIPDDDEDEEDPPNPTKVPFPSPQGLAVIILKEASGTGQLTEAQRAIFSSSKLFKYLNQKVTTINNDRFFRVWDDDYSDSELRNVGEHLKVAYRETKAKANGRLPYIAISNKNKGYHGPLPESIDKTIELIRKYE